MRVSRVVALFAVAAALLSCRKRQACTLRIDDKTVDVVSALASSDGGARVKILLSPERIGCDALRNADRRLERDEVLIEVAPQLLVAEWVDEKRGAFRERDADPDSFRVLSALWKKADGAVGDPLLATLGGDAPPYALKGKETLATGGSMRGHLDLHDDLRATHLSFDGSLSITGCGDHADPQPVLTNVKLLGRAVPIRSAATTLDPYGVPLLVLSSHGDACAPLHRDLEITFYLGGASRRPTRVSMYGDLLPSEQIDALDTFSVEPGALTKVDGAGHLLEIHAALPVTTCPPRAP